MTTGNTEVLLTSGIHNPSKGHTAYQRIFDEYINTFGLPDGYSRYLELMKKAVKLYNNSYNEGKRYLLIKARIAESEAEREISVEGEKIEVIAARISKYLGFQLNLKTTSIAQFYSYIEMMKHG